MWCESRRRSCESFMNTGDWCPLLSRSSSGAVGKRCAAQTWLLTDARRPYLLMTAVRSPRLLMHAQEVSPTPHPSSAQCSLRPAVRLRPAGRPGAQEPRGYDDLTLPCTHALGSRCRARAIMGLTLSKRPILQTSRRNDELLRRAGAGPGLHAQLVSPAVHAVHAHAKRRREHPVYGSRVRWSELDFGDLFRAPQICREHKRHCFGIRGP